MQAVATGPGHPSGTPRSLAPGSPRIWKPPPRHLLPPNLPLPVACLESAPSATSRYWPRRTAWVQVDRPAVFRQLGLRGGAGNDPSAPLWCPFSWTRLARWTGDGQRADRGGPAGAAGPGPGLPGRVAAGRPYGNGRGRPSPTPNSATTTSSATSRLASKITPACPMW